MTTRLLLPLSLFFMGFLPTGEASAQSGPTIELRGAPTNVVVLPAAKRIRFAERLCRFEGATWAAISSDASELIIDESSREPGWVNLEVASGGDCSRTRRFRVFFADPNEPPPAGGRVTIHAFTGLVEVAGDALSGHHLILLDSGGVVTSRACLGERTCTVNVDEVSVRNWLGGARTGVALWRGSAPPPSGVAVPSLWQQGGTWRGMEDDLLPNVTFQFGRPLIEATQVSAADPRTVIPVRFPEAVADVTCQRARCALTPEGIEVFAFDASALSLGVRITLKPRAVRRIDGRLSERENISLEVVRCVVQAPEDVPMLAGAKGHRYYVSIADDCFEGGARDLLLESQPPTASYVKSELPSSKRGWRLFMLVVDSVPSESQRVEFTLTTREPPRTSLGAFAVDLLSDYKPVGTYLSISDLGRIDFIPTNRSADIELYFSDARLDDMFVLESRRGAYEIGHSQGGGMTIQADFTASGNIPLRLAYVPKALRDFLGREETLAHVNTENRYALRRINIPVPLTKPTSAERPIVRVACEQGDKSINIPAGRTTSIPYGKRNSCRIIIDRTAIPEKAGEQQIRVVGPSISEIVTVSHHATPITIALPADDKRMFQAVTIAVGHEYSAGHYDLSPRHNLGAEARYRIVMGDRNFRVTASTSLPTGLFRFGDDGGSVPFSAGAVTRMVWLPKEGQEFPIGWEFGMLGTGLSGEPHFSIVTGLGFSVPVLNPDTSLQTSFNLHAWLEYSPTRDRSWSFLFGPSFTVGRFAADL